MTTKPSDSVAIKHYWEEIYQLRTDAEYIQLLFRNANHISTTLKIVLAVVANLSFAGWLVWMLLDINPSWIWPLLILVSQTVSTVSSFLPYNERLKVYPLLLNELRKLAIQSEAAWCIIEGNTLSSEEISDIVYKMRADRQEILESNMASVLPAKPKLLSEAENLSKEYLFNYYGGLINDKANIRSK